MNKLKTYLETKRLYGIFLHLAIVVLAVEVAMLARQNKELKEGRSPESKESIKEGDYFTLSGMIPLRTDARMDSISANQVIFVFTSRCPFCKETLPFWKQIARRVEGARDVALIGISLDDLAETRAFAKEQKLTFPIFVPEDREWLVETNKLHGVPQTVIRRTSGRVARVWRGRLSEEEFNEVAKIIFDSAANQHS